MKQPEALRQSLIAAFDSCPRRALFSLLDNRRTPSPLAARGTLFHRWHHRAIEHMQARGEATLAVEQGMEYLAEVLCQREVPPEEVVPLTMREMRWIRVLVTKWCEKFELSVDRLYAVEERLYADLLLPGGETRQITGQLDILQAGPAADQATSIDAKTGYARPSEPRDGDVKAQGERGLTELGWVQALIYAVLVFANFPSVQRFTFREWHVFWGEQREVTISRWETERLHDVLAAQVSLLDQAIEGGVDSPRWTESAGPHCAMCARPRDCPIRDEVGIPADEAEARLLAQEWHVAGEVRKDRAPLLKGWVAEHGPVEVPDSRGRRFVGWELAADGKRTFGLFKPPDVPASPFDPLLVDVAREAGVLAE